MKIRNSTRNELISDDAELRDTHEGRRRGLMGSDPKDVVLDVEGDSRINSMIHMFHMRYPIDVIWVDSSMKAVDVRMGIPPSSILKPSSWNHMPKKPARYVIELGRSRGKTIKVGDELEFS